MTGSLSGSYKVGGGSVPSSSNLSPLAQPFMVSKPSSGNPSMNFPDLPAYGTVFDPAGPFSVVGHKFGATEPMVTTTCPPSGGIYGYLGSQTSNSDIYYVGNNNTGYDPFSYGHTRNNIANGYGDDGDVKPHYPPYVSSSPQVNDSRYDLLSSSSSSHFNRYSSPQVDHTHGPYCGEEYKGKCSGFWIGVDNVEHEKWTECAPSFGLKDSNLSSLSGNKSPFSVDGSNQSRPLSVPINNSCPFGDASGKSHALGEVGNRSNLEQGASAPQGLDSQGVGSTISGNSFDIFGGTHHLGSFDIFNQAQKLSLKNPAPSIKSLGQQRPVLESLTFFSGCQTVNDSSSEGQHFGETNCHVSGGNTSSAESTLLGIQVNSVTNKTTSTINSSAGYDTSYHKKPQMPLGVDFHPRVTIKRPLISSKFGSLIRREETVNNGVPDVKFTSDRPKFPPQLPRQFSSEGYPPETNDSDDDYSAEKHSSGSDLRNPAEDSPCWKGTSSTCFSPFNSVSEAVVANVFVPLREETQKENPPVIASDYVGFSSGKESESTFPTVSSSSKSYCIDLNIPDGLHFLDSSILNNQINVLDSKLASAGKQILNEDEISSPVNISEASVAEKSVNCTLTAAQGSSEVSSEIRNDGSCSLHGEKCNLNHNQSAKNPESRFDVGEVLKTMMKLSETLHSYCLGDPPALTYQHIVTLQKIASNLNAAQTSQAMKFSTQDNRFWEGFPVPEMVSYNKLAPPADKQADPDAYFQELPKSFDTFQDYNMTQGIKKNLYDNLHQGIDQPEVSYRNLWLEAEAALCVITTKARFNRMEIEMEKNLQHPMKVRENPLTPAISSDEHGPVARAPEGKDSLALIRESQKCSTTRQCNDTGEIPVSNSQPNFPQFPYQILKTHGDDDSIATLKNDEGKQCSNDTSCIDTHFSVTSNTACDIETPVMTRYQILNSCVGDTETLKRNDGCKKQSSLGEEKIDLSRNSEKKDSKTSVMARYRILTRRMENSGSLHNGKESPQGEDYLISRDPLTPNRQVLTPKLLNPIGATSSGSVMTSIVGPYPNFFEDDNVKKLGVRVSVSGQPLAATSYNENKLKTDEILGEWYENDCSSEWDLV